MRPTARATKWVFKEYRFKSIDMRENIRDEFTLNLSTVSCSAFFFFSCLTLVFTSLFSCLPLMVKNVGKQN